MRDLVSNSAQAADDSANTSGNDHAQLFHTGNHAPGYILTAVIVNSEDVEDDDFDVEVCEEDGTANEYPSNTLADCTALTAPASFAGNVIFTHTGLALSANTNYVVVIKQRGTGSVTLNSTTSGGEDSIGLSDWSIKNYFYWSSTGIWMDQSGQNEALRIIVQGYEAVAVDATDATLSALSVSGATLSPAFDAATSHYGAKVANSVTQVTVTHMTNEPTATVAHTDAGNNARTDADGTTPGFQLALSPGDQTIKVRVTAPDGITDQDYSITIVRRAAVASCSAAAMVNPIWTGNLTAGNILSTYFGFSGFTGDLDDTMFSYGGTNYTIGHVSSGSFLGSTRFQFELDGNFGTAAADLVLHVGNSAYPLSDATLTGNIYEWTSNLPSWANGTGVCLALTADGPDVSSVALTSDPGLLNTYAIGDTVTATVTFDAAVDITGTPQLALDFAGTAKAAACATGTNTTMMVCSYTVVAGDSAPNGVAIAANKLTGGTITATGSTTINADLDHGAVMIDAGHKVDGIRPTLVTTGSDAPTTSTDGTKVILTFSETLLSTVLRTNITIQANGVTLSTTAASAAATKVELTLTTALTATATRSVPENTAANTNIGTALPAATDADNDPLTYTLEGADAASFGFDPATRQLSTKSGVTYDHETKPSYSVTLKADDDNGGSDTLAVTITLTDVEEPPDRPAAPSVTATAGTTDSLSVNWTAPSNTGPAIDNYDLRYREGTGGSWINGPQNVSGTSATIGSLTEGTSYQVQVLARNAEGDSPWSPPGSGQTGALGAPDVPTGLSAMPGNRQVMLSWVQPSGGAEVTHYEYELNNSGTWISTGGAVPSHTVMGLTNGQSYTFRVRAVNSAGASGASGSQSATPTNDGGETILRYEYEQDGSGTWISTDSTATSHTVTGLNNGQTYTFRVRAVNALGNGEVATLEATPSPPTGGGGGGGPRITAPSAPRNLLAGGGDGQVTLTWEAPEDDGGSAITDYEYRIDGKGRWISIGSTLTTHTVTGLVNGQVYVFQVRAVNRNRKGRASHRVEATPRMPVALDFTHFANGAGTTSGLVFVNLSTRPSRPALYFYDREGQLMDPESVVDLTEDLEVTEDGALSVLTEMEPLGELTISTHGRGEGVSGSVKVISDGPIGGFLRFDLPGIGVAGVGASPPVRDALFPARRQADGISTAAAIHNLGEEAMGVSCQLMQGGIVLEEAEIDLEANGQEARYIEEWFTGTDTSDFVGSVRCTAPEEGVFTGVAVELDAGNRIFTTLPVVPVPERMSQE